ncbi:MAG: M67 family metallopeptidase [Planctomycetes bacterium]|nr:M67 family metallopeptidase [Planctomycetota bacterium]
MLYVSKNDLNIIKNEVIKSYPSECCGLLVGRNAAEKKVVEIYPVQNKNTERTHDRYEISGKDFMRVDRSASKKGLQIIGIYHSHPDHPAVPSAFDKENAWSSYSYMIISVEKREDIEFRSWVFNEERKLFIEEKINCIE